MRLGIQGRVQLLELPADTDFCQTGWAIQRLPLHEHIDGVAFHPDSGCYVVGSSVDASFSLPEDDWHHEWANEGTLHASLTSHSGVADIARYYLQANRAAGQA